MKMAKATENDLRASLDLATAMEALEGGYLPNEISNGEIDVKYDERRHAAQVVEYLIGIARRGSLMRVSFGMVVILDPKNEIVDPDSDTLELHPKYMCKTTVHAEVGSMDQKLLPPSKQSIFIFDDLGFYANNRDDDLKEKLRAIDDTPQAVRIDSLSAQTQIDKEKAVNDLAMQLQIPDKLALTRYVMALQERLLQLEAKLSLPMDKSR